MIDEYIKLPYIGKKRAKKLQGHGIGLEEIAQMDEIALKKYIPRISTSKLKVIIATARDIVGRMNQIEDELGIDKHKAKVLALEGYDLSKLAGANKKDIAKLLGISPEQAFDIIFKASLKTGARRVEIKVAKEEISSGGVLSKEGFVNGFGSGWKTIKIEEKQKFRAIPFIVVILLIISGIGASLFLINPGIRIDGNLADWNSVGGLSYGNLTYKYRQVGSTFYFLIEENKIFSKDESFYVAIDDAHGGYWMDGIHAHYVAEFYGWNSTLRGAHLWKYVSGGHLWNFTIASGMTYAFGKNGIEGSMSHIPADSYVIFLKKVKNNVVAETVPLRVSGDYAQVVESNFHQIITNGTSIFRINVTSPEYFVLNSISFEVRGANITEGHVMVNDNSYGLDVSSSVPVAKVHSTVKNAVIVLYANFTGTPASVVSIKAVLHSGNMHFSYVYAMSKMYLFKAPKKVKIDGAFGDWEHQNMRRDIEGDVYDSNIDLVDYASTSNMQDIYMQVRGEFMGGTDIPIVREWHFKDSDHDGVPDKYDPYPHDFNNDGIPDNKSLIMYHGREVPDVDGDGIPDYPYGPDMWLNTTIPDTPNFPPQYRGRHVSVYIGPPPPVKPKNGNDTAEVYFGNGSGGAHLYWVPFPVKYKIVITGRDGVFNSTLYRYDSGKWYSLGAVKNAAAGYHRVELATGLNITNGRMWITIFNWNHNYDTISFGRATRAVLPATNKFFLHADTNGDPSTMNWTAGASSDTVKLITPSDGGVVNATWHYDVPMSYNYHILSANVSLYISKLSLYDQYSWEVNTFNVSLLAVKNTEQSLLLYYNESATNLQEGYKNLIAITNVVNDTVYAGWTLTFKIEFYSNYWAGGGEIDVDYNDTAPYDSNVTIVSDTHIEINNVWTENNSGSVVSNFTKGDIVDILANVTDPLGYEHIDHANVSLVDSLNNTILSNSAMSAVENGSGYIVYSFSFQLVGNPYVYTGKYPITVKAEDKENFSVSNDSSAFWVNAHIKNINSKNLFVPAGEYSAWFSHQLTNLGDGDDIINFAINPSQKPSFNVVLYRDVDNNKIVDSQDVLYAVYNVTQGAWTYIRNDTDGNGEPDITVMHGESVGIIMAENVSLNATNPKEVLSVTFGSFTGNTSTTVNDTAILRDVKTKTLYLRGGGDTYTTVPDTLYPIAPTGTTDITTESNADWEVWNMTIPFANDFVFAGDIEVIVNLEDKPGSPPSSDNNITLVMDDGTYIGSVDFTTPDLTQEWYTFNITPQIPLIPAGHSIEMEWYASSKVDLHFNSTTYPSRIVFNTTSYVYVENVTTYNSTTLVPQTNFTAGENTVIRAVVRDPFGMYDLSDVHLNVTSPNGTVSVNYTMTLIEDDTSYGIYSYNYSIPADAFVGQYNISVRATESNGVYNDSSGDFIIPCNITITPSTNSSKGTEVWYNHTIWNNGSGADIVDILVYSNQTVNVTLYVYQSGVWEVVAYSDTGTGWNSVASGYDTDNDGNPDFEIAKGSSIRIAIRVVTSVNVSTQLVVHDSYLCVDNATDTTTVPEMSSYAMVTFPMLLIALAIRRRKRHS